MSTGTKARLRCLDNKFASKCLSHWIVLGFQGLITLYVHT
jgi:hypothetical protein